MSFWKTIGKIGKIALPIVGGVLGGPLGGIAGGALGGAVSSGKVKDIVGGAAAGGLGAAALGKAGGIKGAIAKIGQNPGQFANLGLAGLSTIQGAQQQGKANKLNEQVLQQAQQEQAQRNALRQQAIAKIGSGTVATPNLSGLYAGSSNPFAKVR